MGKYFCLAQDPHPTLSSVLIIAIAVFRKHVEVSSRELCYLSEVISGCSGKLEVQFPLQQDTNTLLTVCNRCSDLNGSAR